ncbi:MAG TPA: tetratricopeptide repeat protein [Puia sp.]|nr:tetratricopeptide repeat protein [Puia sp.]
MAKLLLLAVFVAQVPICAGQPTAPVDSFLRIVRQHPGRDSSRVAALVKLADATVYTDPVAAMRDADEALAISEELHWVTGLAISWRQKGNAYYNFSDDLAAMDCYMKALNISRPLGNRELDATLINNLANIYSDEKQYDKALDYYRRFMEVARDLRSTKKEVIGLVNMGTVYTELGDQEKAIESGRQALVLCRRDGIDYFVPIILNNLGIAWSRKGKPDSALDYFHQSVALADKSGNNDAKASSLEEIGKVYLARGDYANTEKFALQSLAIARQLQSAEWQTSAWQSLYQVYEKRHEEAKALEAYKQYILFRDSVSNAEKQTAMAKKEMQFDFERKEAATKADNDEKAAIAQAEINRQGLIRKGMVTGVVVLLLAGLSSFVLYKRRRDAEERRRDAEERRKEADLRAKVSATEMKVLRLQMNPHFIFNSLNSVSDYISRNETTTANYFLSKFAKMMRQVLEHSEKSEITLAEDLQVVETYIQLERLRLRNDLCYEIVVDREIDPEVTMVPPLIVQPFVENSIWHGFSGRSHPGKISIRITREDGMIYYIVEDNGIGRKEAGKYAPAGRRSMGLRITRDRIDIINQAKGARGGKAGKEEKAGVEIFDLSEGTRVELRLPLELNY